MVDVSKYNFDTPVLIRITDDVGTFVPELSTYTPLEAYASISQVISIMNRTGIAIEFPKQSSEREISKKIEDLLLDYNNKVRAAEDKGYFVEGDISNALNTIQYINDSKITEDEIKEEIEKHIFEYDDIILRIYEDLRGSELDRIFESEEYTQDKDILKEAEKQRKAEDRVHNFKKESLKQRSLYDWSSIKFHNYMIDPQDNFYTDTENIQFIADRPNI